VTIALRINVAGLLKETAGAAREYPLVVPTPEVAHVLEDARPAAPLEGHVRLMRTQQSVFVRGRVRTRVAVECSRCLEETEVPLDIGVEAEFFPEVDVTTGQSLTVPDDDLAFSIDQNHELDLSEAVRQGILLEMPMHAVCRETCKGLCPECGADLNLGACTCEPEVTDERLAPLRALLEGREAAS
jgi:uncharacterized protein